jgi:two-component system chemotaxis response regulator CheB
LAVVQDPADAIAGGMPRAALETVHVDYVLPVREIPAVLTALTMKGGERERIWAMHDADEEKDKSRELPQRDLREQALGQRPNATSVYTCPECGGTLWEVDENGLTQFACHVGHRYGAEILLGQMSEELEAALWRCVRMFTEKATLTRQLAHRTRTSGDAEAAQRIEEQAALDDRHEAILRALVQEGTLRQLAQVLAAEEG